jgi:uncharacterized phage protein gp47/JayE
MALSLAQLITPVTEDQALETLLGFLESFGFQTTSWQSGSVQRNLIQMSARVYSDLTETIADVAKSGFAKLATGLYADYLGVYSYKLVRVAATNTLGQMVLTSSAAAPVHNWVAGELLMADADVGENANTFEVLDAGTLNPGNSVTVNVRAAVAGVAGNVAPNIPLFLWTPLVGVTATNPPLAGSSTWITTPGADAEADPRYSDRMLGRWDRLTYGNTEGAYRAWALEALPELTRVAVSFGASGAVTVIGATATGGLTGPQISTITDYMNGATDGVGRRPVNDVLTVASATTITTPAVTATITVSSPYSADAIARVTAALIALFGLIPLGGIVLPGQPGKILLSDLYKTVMAQQGVVNVVFTSPVADITLAVTDIYSPTIALTMIIAP